MILETEALQRVGIALAIWLAGSVIAAAVYSWWRRRGGD